MRRFSFLVLLAWTWWGLGPACAFVVDAHGHVNATVAQIFHVLKPWIRQKNAALPAEQRVPPRVLSQALDCPSPPLRDLHRVAQAIFLRTVERSYIAQQEPDPHLLAHRPQLLALFRSMGCLNPVWPSRDKSYRYILVPGATVKGMWQRLGWLFDSIATERLLSDGARVVVLTGKRDLFSQPDGPKGRDWEKRDLMALVVPELKAQAASATTEDEAARWMVHSKEMATGISLKAQFVVADKRNDGKGHWIRPTTYDTARTWMELKPSPGACVLFSSQPFIDYQQMVLTLCLEQAGGTGFTVDGVGPGVPEIRTSQPEEIPILLDNLARLIAVTLELQRP